MVTALQWWQHYTPLSFLATQHRLLWKVIHAVLLTCIEITVCQFLCSSCSQSSVKASVGVSPLIKLFAQVAHFAVTRCNCSVNAWHLGVGQQTAIVTSAPCHAWERDLRYILVDWRNQKYISSSKNKKEKCRKSSTVIFPWFFVCFGDRISWLQYTGFTLYHGVKVDGYNIMYICLSAVLNSTLLVTWRSRWFIAQNHLESHPWKLLREGQAL